MFGAWLHLEQVDYVDEEDLQIRELLPKKHSCGQSLLRGDIAGGSHDEIGLFALIVAGPLPNPNSLGAVRSRRIHIEVLKMQLLVRNDHVDVVLASEAVVRDRQKTVRIGRKINARNGGALIQNNVQETRILMSEAVMILPPDGGRN